VSSQQCNGRQVTEMHVWLLR